MTRALVFDSGVGGLTIADALRKAAPGWVVDYAADSGFFPYGVKTDDELRARLPGLCATLVEVARPDVLVIVFNDHVTSFFFDHYSQFALGIGESYAPADEGGGPRALPPVRGHAPLAHHIAAGLVADEFDTASQPRQG